MIEDFISPAQCNLLSKGMDAARAGGRMRIDDNFAYSGPNNQYSPVPAQVLLGTMAPRLSALIWKSLQPSFSFWRIYESGAVLNPHKDRKECEVSVTVAVASEPESHVWPIGLTDLAGNDHSVVLQPGSALLYLGTEVPHWRKPLTGDQQYQMFLHDVLADGPYADRAFDKGRTRIP